MTALYENSDREYESLTNEQNYDKFMKILQDIIKCLSSTEIQHKTCELTLKHCVSQLTEITLCLEYLENTSDKLTHSAEHKILSVKSIILTTHVKTENYGVSNNIKCKHTEAIKKFALRLNINICDPDENPDFGLHFELTSVREIYDFETVNIFNEKNIPTAQLNHILNRFYDIIEPSNINQENNVLHTITCCQKVSPNYDKKDRILKNSYDKFNNCDLCRDLYYAYVLMIKNNGIKQNIQNNLSELMRSISMLFSSGYWDIKIVIGIDINDRILEKYIFM